MVPIKTIHKVVCDYYDISWSQPFWRSKRREVVKPRQIIQYLSRLFNGEALSHRKIGQYYYRDSKNYFKPTTVMHSIGVVNKYITTENIYRNEINDLKKIIQFNIVGSNAVSFNIEKVELIKMISNADTSHEMYGNLSNYLILMRETE